MEKLKRIPLLGYLIRFLIGLVELPKHLSRLYQQIDNLSREVEKLNQCKFERMDEISNITNRLHQIEQVQMGEDFFLKLNRKLSISPVIWGDEKKLDISELAAVSSCVFNTNSGHISVGDYTFAGYGVSLLAGSHDMTLSGLPRRDSEMISGCDIVIGKGVWLASNCTILGPAVVGDNAVVAAGAVVTPGTVIPSNTVYGGIPARYLRDVTLIDIMDVGNLSIKMAIERCDGVLYLDGWTDKRIIINEGKEIIGHYLAESRASVYMSSPKCSIFYKISSNMGNVSIKLEGEVEQIYELSSDSGFIEFRGRQVNDSDIYVISVEKLFEMDFFVTINMT